MNKNHSKLLKILLALFLLNSLSVFLYYIHNSSTENHSHPSEPKSFLNDNHQTHSFTKPWPILPSYLPWSQTTDSVALRSCEGYFGNGFTKRLDLLLPPPSPGAGGGGWFRCFYSHTLKTSVCEGGKLKMVPERIKMSKGGELLENVIGRGEEEEMPVFEEGAFEVVEERLGMKRGRKGNNRRLVSDDMIDQYLPGINIQKHTIRELIASIRAVDSLTCDEWVEEPTLLVTRYEYANMFHTVTDWYSAYVSSRVTGLPNRPHVVFLDGHCTTQLEETWIALFSSIRYAKNFTGSVCFRHAILPPLGYETALFKGLTETVDCQGASAHALWQSPDDQKTARLSEFGEMIRSSFGFQVNRHRIEKPMSAHNILFVRREDYLAHPRHGGRVESRLSNEQEVYSSLERWASNYSEGKINLINGLFAHMSMKEQVRAIQDASVIIGAHGAGLTHIVSATPKTVILEIISSYFRRPHFALIAKWKGLVYHAIDLDGSYANPEIVIDRLTNIMRSLA